MVKKSPLYDAKPESKGAKSDKEAAATAEADMARGDKPRADKEAPKSNSADMLLSDLRDMHKRHEGERKDTHNNHREMMRQMSARHEKEISAMMEKFHPAVEGNANEADGGKSAPGGMAVVDGMEE